jgi:hypothetical protein
MKLSEELTMWRADRPDGWMMDEFINAAEQLESEVERLHGLMPPNEHGTNRYGLDMSYFRNLINRDLNRPLDNHQPSDFARMLARMSRTADENVMYEPEFQRLRCGGEAVFTVKKTGNNISSETNVDEILKMPDGEHKAYFSHPAPAVRGGVDTCSHGIRTPHECRECEDSVDTETAVLWYAYQSISEMLEPHMDRSGSRSGGLPSSVTEAVQMLLDERHNYTHPAPAVPDGYTLVPNEPTEVMFEALCNTPWVIEGSIEGNCFVTKEFPNQRYVLDGWKAMLKAAQKENGQ